MKKNKTQPKQQIVHLRGPHPEKGVCDKRGTRTRHEPDVTCPECKAMLHRADSVIEAMLKMLGAGASQ